MKIVANTSNDLVIRDTGTPIRIAGGFVVALGIFAAWLAFASDPEGGIGRVPLVLGSIIRSPALQ